MGVRSGSVRQADITRALRAAKDAGLEVARYEIQSGKVIVFTTAGETLVSGRDDLDQELAQFEARRGEH
jgi:hypothetical protein